MANNCRRLFVSIPDIAEKSNIDDMTLTSGVIMNEFEKKGFSFPSNREMASRQLVSAVQHDDAVALNDCVLYGAISTSFTDLDGGHLLLPKEA